MALHLRAGCGFAAMGQLRSWARPSVAFALWGWMPCSPLDAPEWQQRIFTRFLSLAEPRPK